jgi:D-alanyl-D-alanine carboxypeptidase (penicillin-binding protein 5/6)
MRLISVILGVTDVGPVSGALLRAEESAALLDYGFETFTTVRVLFGEPARIHVWKGKRHAVGLRLKAEPIVALRKNETTMLHTRIEQVLDTEAPVRTSQTLGAVVVSLNGKELARFPLQPDADVARGGFFSRAIDSVVMFLRGIHPRRLTDAAPTG